MLYQKDYDTKKLESTTGKKNKPLKIAIKPGINQ